MKLPEDKQNLPNRPSAADPKAEASSKPAEVDMLNALADIQNSHSANPEKQGMSSEPKPAASNPKPRDGGQSKQAAQPSDKAETDVALVGGQSPKPPETQSKRKSNKFTFRVDDDLQYSITQYAIAAGIDESEAARRLIEMGLGKSHIVISPKSPPQLLEFFAGALKSWSKDLATIKSRLNAPMPTTDDKDLVALVTNWRSIAAQLQSHVPTLIQSAQAVSDLLTSLNSEKIKLLRNLHAQLVKWIASREATLTKQGLPEAEAASHKSVLKSYCALRSLIEELGIIKPKGL